MKYVQCPETFDYDWTTMPDIKPVFIGGGISGCSNWQEEDFLPLVQDWDDNWVFINPRRASFDINDPTASKFQIHWEYKHLNAPGTIRLFWFPHETLCPITLFELGSAARTIVGPLIVGCDPKYARAFDVKEQLSLIELSSHVQVRDSISALVDDLKAWDAWKSR
jgi:hypothetical protein